MSVNEVHVGDIGTVFTFTVKDGSSAIDISAATTTGMLLLNKPSGTTSTLTVAFTGGGTDGIFAYTSTSSDFEEVGTHRFQGVIKDTSNTWNTDIYVFKVFSNLPVQA